MKSVNIKADYVINYGDVKLGEGHSTLEVDPKVLAQAITDACGIVQTLNAVFKATGAALNGKVS